MASNWGFGIDFGTTNSVVAWFDGKRIQSLIDPKTGLPHPSVVWFQGNRVTVGREARAHLNTYSGVEGNHFVKSVKRRLGHDEDYVIFGERVAPNRVASHIFHHLKQQAAASGFDVGEAVITIPVHFTGRQRRDLRRAAADAGIAVKTFIHEPFAAIVGWLHRPGAHSAALHTIRNVLVFDWGGGTLDVTLARLEAGQVFELAKDGINDLAGDHFDELLMDYARTAFRQEHHIVEDALRLEPHARDRLGMAAELAKIGLSDEEHATIQLAKFFKLGPTAVSLHVPVERQTFAGLIKRDVDHAISKVHGVLEKARLAPEQIDLALMVGGTSRIPFIAERLRQLFGVKVEQADERGTLIAEGAAIIAYHDWCPYLVHPLTVQLSDGSQYPVIEPGTLLKAKVTHKEVRFFCTDNRDGEARLILTESPIAGDSGPAKTILTIPVSRKVVLRQNERVHAVFEVDDDLVLRIKAGGVVEGHLVQGEMGNLCYGLKTGGA